MWDLLIDNGIWILTTSIIGFFLFLILRNWCKRIITSTIPDQFRPLMEVNLKVVKRIIIVLGSLILVLGATLTAISIMGGDVTPALAMGGVWFREHGVRIFIIIGLAYLILRLFAALIPQLIAMSTTATGNQYTVCQKKVCRAFQRMCWKIS